MMHAPHSRRRRVLSLSLSTLAGLTAFSAATGATTASAAGAADPAITDADVSQAALGVLTFGVLNVTDPVTSPCPMVSAEELGWFMGQQGFAPNLATFGVDVYYNNEVGDGYPGIDCGVDLEGAENPDPATPHYPIVGAVYLSEGVTFAAYLEPLEGTILTPAVADPNIGGEIGGVCAGGRICWLNWHRGELVVSVVVAGGTGGDIDRARVETLLLSMVPTVVDNLIASSGGDVPAATTVPAVAVPATAVPTPPTLATIPVTVATVPPTAPTPTSPTPTSPTPTSTAGAIPAPTQQPTGLGADPALDVLAQACYAGDLAACDQLFDESPAGSAYESFADTCAGRQPAGSGRYCVDVFGGGSATTIPPVTTVAPATTIAPVTTAVAPAGLDTTAAKAGLARYFAGAPIDTFVAGGACPVGAGQLLVSAMTANGLTPTTDQFDVTTVGLDPVSPTTPQLFCMMAVPLETVPRGSVFVSDITGVTTFAELITANGGHPIANPDPTTGGELGGNCYDYEGRYSCWVMWHRDGLVIDVYMTAAPGALTEAAAVAVTTQLVPQYVANLGSFQV